MDENEDIYLIPRNVRTKFEFFEGFGWKELFIMVLGAAASILLFLIIYLLTKSVQHKLINLPRIIVLFTPISLAFIATRPDPATGLSVLTLFSNFKAFLTMQKRYLYYFGKGRD